MAFDHAALIRDHRVDIVAWDGAIVAVIEMVERPDDVLIKNLAVDPGAQGRGFGGLLLAHAEATARAEQCSAVRLYTNADFAANIVFYLARGFVIENETVTALATAVHFVKIIGSAAAAA